MDKKKIFGDRLKELRKKKKLTQDQLSKKSGIDRTFIAHIEAGSRNVSLETMQSLFEGLDVTYKYFFSTEQFN